MLLILPIATFVLLVWLMHERQPGWRAAFMRATTLWAALAVAINELLSVPNWLSATGISIAWLMVAAGGCIFHFVETRAAGGEAGNRTDAGKESPGECLWLVASCVAILALVGIVAVLSPPNTSDSMRYHSPRVVHWLQNHNVGYWPTSNALQLYMSPGAEYLVLHLHALTGGDRFDGLVQWFSMLASTVGVSLIAQRLGAALTGQAFAALLCATIPQGILEASGVKNDFVTALWVVALVYFMLEFARDAGWANTAYIGLTLGLSYLTKTTALLFIPPIALCIFVIYKFVWNRALIARLMLVCAIAAMVNLAPAARNFRFNGALTADTSIGTCHFMNQKIGVSTTVSNVVRNLGLHMVTPSNGVNALIGEKLKQLLRTLGIQPDSPDSTWCASPFQIPEFSTHEAQAPNTLHLFLFLASVATLAFRSRLRDLLPLKLYAAGLMLAFASFCAVLTWQPWHTRLHLPLFVLSCALTGAVISSLWPRWTTAACSAILLIAASPFVLQNEIRPLILQGNILDRSRAELSFADRGFPGFYPFYKTASDFVKKTGCRDIGLDVERETFEYPLLSLLDGGYRTYNVRHMPVPQLQNKVANPMQGFNPCVVVCVACSDRTDAWQKYLKPGITPSVFGSIVVFTVSGKTP